MSFSYSFLAKFAFVCLLLTTIGVLTYWNKDLREDNRDLINENNKLLVELIKAQDQITALGEREEELNTIEDQYGKAKNELKNKGNGPVAPVLRYAIDTDFVQ